MSSRRSREDQESWDAGEVVVPEVTALRRAACIIANVVLEIAGQKLWPLTDTHSRVPPAC